MYDIGHVTYYMFNKHNFLDVVTMLMLTNITHEKILSTQKSPYTVFHSQKVSSVNNISHISAQVTCNNMFVLKSRPEHLQALQFLASDNITQHSYHIILHCVGQYE